MKLTVLCDNNTRIDAYYLAEPGVSYYIEEGDYKLLFDTGYSDVYLKNAKLMGIDLRKIDGLVFSHGHMDHTWGIQYFPKAEKTIKLYDHTKIFCEKRCKGFDPEDIGFLKDYPVDKNFELHLSDGPVYLTPRLIYLGAIPRVTDFESKKPIGEILIDGKWEPDYLPEDSALCYIGEGEISVITGCSHAGICNIIEYAKKVTGISKVDGVLGGFHLKEHDEQSLKTVEYLKNLKPKRLYPSHCTCFYSKAAMNQFMTIGDLCVGDTVEWEEKNG